MEEDDFNPYCVVCGCCGEEGCCSIEKSLLGHGCQYAITYARDVYFNQIVLDELLSYMNDHVEGYDHIVKEAYDKAWVKADEKYKNFEIKSIDLESELKSLKEENKELKQKAEAFEYLCTKLQMEHW